MRGLACVAFTASCAASPAPAAGATYARQIHLPLLGTQRVQIHIHSAEHATAHLAGPITATEDVRFRSLPDGRMDLELGPTLQREVRRLGATIRHASYDAAHDVAVVCVKPPLIGVVHVRLARMPTSAPDR